jgi:hypothetical protein
MGSGDATPPWAVEGQQSRLAAFNAATTAWHLCDWIKTYPEVHPDSGLEIDPSKYRPEVLERCPRLELCQQIANGWKHRIINETNVPEIQANRVINLFVRTDADGIPAFDKRPLCEPSYAVWDGRQHIDLVTLFDQIIDFWNNELKRLKLKPAAGDLLWSLIAAQP